MCFSSLDPTVPTSPLLYGMNFSSVQEVQTMPAFSLVMNTLFIICEKISELLIED
jgi:hypothetical protein